MITLVRRWFSCLSISLAIALCCALPSWADGVSRRSVDIVYRFDTRSPEEIFANGFTPRGEERNLILHALTWTEQSAFIATTSIYEAAARVARADMEVGGDPEAVGYIYGIAPNANFYQVIPALESFLERQRGLPVAVRNQGMEARLELAIDAYSWEHEYVSVAPIPETSIIYAVQVSAGRDERGRFRLNWGEFRTNPNEDAHHEFTNPRDFADDHPLAWPDESPSSSSPPLGSPVSCQDASSVSAGAIGTNCSGDLHAVVSRGDAIHRAMLPSCHSPVREKRGTGVPLCFGALQLVNISKLARLRAAVLSEAREDWDAWLAQEDLEHDEL